VSARSRLFNRIQNRPHTLFFAGVAVGQFTGHGDRQMIARRRLGDHGAELQAELLGSLPECEGKRFSKSAAIRDLDIRTTDIQTEPCHLANLLLSVYRTTAVTGRARLILSRTNARIARVPT
jgi:hypothetical protein